MKNYHVTITADRYPTNYTVAASNWHTAVARAIKEWRERFKGSRTEILHIRAVKGSELLTASQEDLKDEPEQTA